MRILPNIGVNLDDADYRVPKVFGAMARICNYCRSDRLTMWLDPHQGR